MLQSVGSQRVGHNLATEQYHHLRSVASFMLHNFLSKRAVLGEKTKKKIYTQESWISKLLFSDLWALIRNYFRTFRFLAEGHGLGLELFMQMLLPRGTARLACLAWIAAKSGCGACSCSHRELTWGLLMFQASSSGSLGWAAGRTPLCPHWGGLQMWALTPRGLLAASHCLPGGKIRKWPSWFLLLGFF